MLRACSPSCFVARSEDLNLCHLFFPVHLSPRRPHFVLIVRQRSPEFSAVLLASLYEMVYAYVRQGRSPESASCLVSWFHQIPSFT
jgi:hypothetical protein